MKMSCNGCRVLRKGCSPDCILKPCLQWISSPESQANATLFLAKFYGRAGLVNLVNAGPQHLHPDIFRSLLYEACGRIINPVQGAVGLLSSGDWARCQAAVDAVLQGSPISGDDSAAQGHPCDIRHAYNTADLRHIKVRNRFSRTVNPPVEKFSISGWKSPARSPDDCFSVETVEATLLNPMIASREMGLELTLGRNQFYQVYV